MKMHSNVKGMLYHVLYVLKLTCNLFSVKAAVAMGNTVKFGSNKCWIRDEKERLCAMGSLENKLYLLDCEVVCDEQALVSEQGNDLDLWHQRCGHLNEQQLKGMVQKGSVTGVKV